MAQQAQFSRPTPPANLRKAGNGSRPANGSRPGNGSRSIPVDDGERRRLIEQAAYERFARRGFAHGHDMEDWLMAEADVDRMLTNSNAPESAEEGPEDRELQQGASRSIIRGETMNRIVRQHPLRDGQKV